MFRRSTWRSSISAWAIASALWTSGTSLRRRFGNGWAALKEDRIFDPLRSEPRFIALLKKVGFDN